MPQTQLILESRESLGMTPKDLLCIKPVHAGLLAFEDLTPGAMTTRVAPLTNDTPWLAQNLQALRILQFFSHSLPRSLCPALQT